jgi:hypothetical protein
MKGPAPECFKNWCDLANNAQSPDCKAFEDFCDGNGGKNWELPECTAPCELDANAGDARCKEGAAGRR